MFNYVVATNDATDSANWIEFYIKGNERGSFTLSLENSTSVEASTTSSSVQDFKSILSSFQFK